MLVCRHRIRTNALFFAIIMSLPEFACRYYVCVCVFAFICVFVFVHILRVYVFMVVCLSIYQGKEELQIMAEEGKGK